MLFLVIIQVSAGVEFWRCKGWRVFQTDGGWKKLGCGSFRDAIAATVAAAAAFPLRKAPCMSL